MRVQVFAKELLLDPYFELLAGKVDFSDEIPRDFVNDLIYDQNQKLA